MSLQSDFIASFEESFERAKDPGAQAHADQLYSAWQSWLVSEGADAWSAAIGLLAGLSLAASLIAGKEMDEAKALRMLFMCGFGVAKGSKRGKG